MNGILNLVLFLLPPLLSGIIHGYISRRAMGWLQKTGIYFLYLALNLVFVQAAACLMGLGGKALLFTEVTYRIKLVLVSCIFAFVSAMLLCLFFEKNVTWQKMEKYTVRFFSDLKKYMRYALRSAKADLKSEVANSYLDWLWWLLEPFCMMLIYTLVFGVVFRAKEPYFPVFVFVGLTMWNFFSKNMSAGVSIVKSNKSIVSKVYLPKYVLLLARLFVNGFKMLICFGIVVGMMAVYHVTPTVTIWYVAPVLLCFFLFTFAVGTFLLHYGVFVSDLSQVTNIVLRMLVYLSGVFYSVEKRIPLPYGELLEKFNPVAFFIASLRNALLYGEAPSGALLVLWTVISAMLAALGIYTIYRNENAYVKVI